MAFIEGRACGLSRGDRDRFQSELTVNGGYRP